MGLELLEIRLSQPGSVRHHAQAKARTSLSETNFLALRPDRLSAEPQHTEIPPSHLARHLPPKDAHPCNAARTHRLPAAPTSARATGSGAGSSRACAVHPQTGRRGSAPEPEVGRYSSEAKIHNLGTEGAEQEGRSEFQPSLRHTVILSHKTRKKPGAGSHALNSGLGKPRQGDVCEFRFVQ